MARRKNKKPNNSALWAVLLVIVVAGAACGGYFYYTRWLVPNIRKEGKLFIPTGATYNQALDSIAPFLENKETFAWLARHKNYQAKIWPGRYTVKTGESNQELLQRLLYGVQDEIPIRIGNYSSIFEMAGRVAPLLETDSAKMVAAMLEADFAKGCDTAALTAFYFPDTYNFHWNTSAAQFVKRMKSVYDQYWTAQRIAEAQAQNLTPMQATTLASIVQLESAHADEQPRVAGLYLNRLKIGMKLDADPTVIYAKKKAEGFNTKIQRVYYKDLAIASPYNTYRVAGLPPSPICMPNKSAMEAVLHPVRHDFLYFVADPSKPGYHIYARTLAEQEKNAATYRQWLNKNNIQ
ncbi:MAG: endolytic transglycosylase MltG [Edaphocola sp.]